VHAIIDRALEKRRDSSVDMCLVQTIPPPDALTLGMITLENVIEKIIQEEILGTVSIVVYFVSMHFPSDICLFFCFLSVFCESDEMDSAKGSKTGGGRHLPLSAAVCKASPLPRRFSTHHVRSRSSSKVLPPTTSFLPSVNEQCASAEKEPLVEDDAVVSYGGTSLAAGKGFYRRLESVAVVPVSDGDSGGGTSASRSKQYRRMDTAVNHGLRSRDKGKRLHDITASMDQPFSSGESVGRVVV
jgi:hypothetical protein